MPTRPRPLSGLDPDKSIQPAAEELSRALRGWEQDNPLTSMALGFTPVGLAFDAAALIDPSATMLDKGLALLGPAGETVSALRRLPRAQSDITVYHGGERIRGRPEAGRIGGEGSYDEGPGFYVTDNPEEARAYARATNPRQAFGGADPMRDISAYELPDELIDTRVMNLDVPYQNQTGAVRYYLDAIEEGSGSLKADYGDLPDAIRDSSNPVREFQKHLYSMGQDLSPDEAARLQEDFRNFDLLGVKTMHPEGGFSEPNSTYFSVYDPSVLEPKGAWTPVTRRDDLPITRLPGTQSRPDTPGLVPDKGYSAYFDTLASHNMPDPTNLQEALRNYSRAQRWATETNVAIDPLKLEQASRAHKLSPEELAEFTRIVRGH